MSISLSVREVILSRYKWACLFAALAVFLLLGARSVYSHTIPTISIISVNPGESVTVRTHNFPPNQTFIVTMGQMGTRGVGGTIVTNTYSNNGGSFDVTYAIPAAWQNQRQIAIRLQTTHAYPYYAYNWFYNVTPSSPPDNNKAPEPAPAAYSGIPTFKISAVDRNNNVTITTNNFPANQRFTVTMGRFGTRGVGGIVVGAIDSGAGGTLSQSFAIPTDLQGLNRIAIRAQTAHANPYFAYNWFYNNSTGESATEQPATTTESEKTESQTESPQVETQPTVVQPISPPFTGIPTFKVCSVVRNNTITIKTSSLPANQTFFATMGVMYSRGVGGFSVGNFPSGDGSPQTILLTIPPQLQNSNRIAVRIQTGHAAPYFAYNWFYNNTATVC